MNLRNGKKYTIGLDIGTGSVGWAVVDENGELYRIKGKNTWGSRLFPSAETAAETRLKRGQRRRYARRRFRLNLLQEMFAAEVVKIDPDFYIRLNQSRLLREDRREGHSDYQYPLFNDSNFSEKEYYKKFPTIYHLRKHLMESSEKEDIRLIYLAFHNIVKCRGNFLHQDEKGLSAKTANASKAVSDFADTLHDYAEVKGIELSLDDSALLQALSDANMSKAEKRDAIKRAFVVSKEYEDYRKLPAEIAKAVVGDMAEYAEIFNREKQTETKFSFTNEEKVLEFGSLCADDDLSLFEAIQGLYFSFVLSGILKGSSGGTISDSMIEIYTKHSKDLAFLKDIVQTYAPEHYDTFFRGKKDASGQYVAHQAKGYTAYIIGEKKLSQDDLYKEIKKIFAGIVEVEAMPKYKAMLSDMAEGTFLQKLKNRNNGAIPYQLHLEEMTAIIEAQSQHYPFLAVEKEKIESLVSFRIPYYVGPLNSKHQEKNGGKKFAWSKRVEGKESETVYPWNFDEVIDKDSSAEEFILRMTGKCTYLLGEDVLPRHSLLYEEFCVLNELNATQWNKDGENFYRFDSVDRHDLFEEVFKTRKTVSHRAVSDWLRKRGFSNTTLRGTQEENKFVSQLSTYNDFKKILDAEIIDENDIPMIEELVLWNTIFEDKEILKRKIEKKYSDRLSADQIKKVCAKRYTGWGRLSKRLLSEMSADVDGGAQSTIIEIMREHEDGKGKPLTLMEILNHKDFGFMKAIEEYNIQNEADGTITVDDIPGSPALKRAVNQSLRIIDELASIAPEPPAKICLEVTRDDDYKKKGKRTQSRYKKLEEAYQAFKREYPEVYKELAGHRNDLGDDRLMLYFSQLGKCLYSGKTLDINRLYEYQVDHILPQSYIKNDSFDNKALVIADENERKLDSMLLEADIIASQKPRWRTLRDAGLMSDFKFNSLIRTEVKDRALEGFINRQLVETSQIIKHVANLLRARYPETTVVPVRASLGSGLRNKCELVKCRELNDYHHAHDAYLACQIDRFINYRYPKLADGFDMTVFKRFIKNASADFKNTKRITGSAGFIIESFLKSGFDKETGEIFKDAWDAEAEIARIRKCLNYSDCFISRMPEITSGSFWKETIYSPQDPKMGKNLEIPLKNNTRTDSYENYLDPKKYGGPSGKDYAYFFAFAAMDTKGKQKVFFEGLPLYLAQHVENDEAELLQYATKLAEKSGCIDVRVLKKRIMKYQKIYLDGNAFYITGLKEARNARQLALTERDRENVLQANSVREGGSFHGASKELHKTYLTIAGKLATISPKLNSLLKLELLYDGFCKADYEDQCKCLIEILSVISGNKNQIDLSAVRSSKAVGKIQLTYTKELPEITFADTSVTGIFERVYKLEL